MILFDHWRRMPDGSFISTEYEYFGLVRIDGKSRVMPGPAVPVLEARQPIGRLRLELVKGKFRATLNVSRPVPVCVFLVREARQSVRLESASVSQQRVEVA